MRKIRVTIELLEESSGSDREDFITLQTARGEVKVQGERADIEDAVSRLASNGLEIVLPRP